MLSIRRVVAYCNVYYICTTHEEQTHVYSGYGQRIFGLETDAGWAVKTEGEANVVLYNFYFFSQIEKLGETGHPQKYP